MSRRRPNQSQTAPLHARFKAHLEGIAITPTSWLLGISGIVMVRFFLESLSCPATDGYFTSDAPSLIHYYLFFLTVAVSAMLFLRFAIPSWRAVTPHLTVLSMTAVLIAPTADWLISGGAGFRLAYLFDPPRALARAFLTFFGPHLFAGITIGIRIEIAIILVMVATLVFLIERSLARTVLAAFGFYSMIFMFLALPAIFSIVMQGGRPSCDPSDFINRALFDSSTVANYAHGSMAFASRMHLYDAGFNYAMGRILFVLLIIVTGAWFYVQFPGRFRAFIGNSRPERVAHYLLMILLGMIAAVVNFPRIHLNWSDGLALFALAAAYYFAWMFAVGVNDLVDEEIDAVSNPDRPLSRRSLSRADMQQAAAMSLAASLLASFLAGYTAFFFVLAFTALYYVYSAPPTRFKTIPLFSSFLISLCCLTAALAGFFILAPEKTVASFPPRLVAGIVTIYFFAAHLRDLKDVAGDQAAGVRTVPVILGPTWGPRVVGAFVFLAFILVPIFMRVYLLFVTALPAGAAACYFINRTPYSEKRIFRTYFIFIAASVLVLAGNVLALMRTTAGDR